MFSPMGNEIVSNFVGQCKQKKLQLYSTETVRDEATQRFPTIVNRYFDKVGVRAHVARMSLYAKFWRRLMDLFKCCKVEKVEAAPSKIRAMYRDFSREPALLKILKQLQAEKHRKSLFPGETDMQILAEADKLGEKFNVSFITDDHDFLYFKNEIESRLRIRMTALLDLPHYFDK